MSKVHPPLQKTATPSVSKDVKTSGKSSELIIPNKDKNTAEEESRLKGSELINPSMHVDDPVNPMALERSETDKELRKFVASVLKEVNSDALPDVQTSLAKDPSPENESREKAEENVPDHTARERRISPSRKVKRKADGLKGTPCRSFIGKSPVGPTRSKSPLDNASSHYVKNAERWKYVIQRRVALERELGKDALKCKEAMELIEAVGLMKTVTHFGPCYENLVKEIVVTIPDGCDDTKSADHGKVYARGNVITFSPAAINKFLGRTNEPQAELEVTSDQVCKEITTKQVRHWPNKGKLSADKLSVKYAILHRIGTANWVPNNHTSTISIGLGKFIYVVGTKKEFDFGKYIFE
ncbi:uncharacterized protein LOC127078633 [Lathyrus oleraceus]|uniref:uncharacterized protein LOC127078633 n=1 Tax=Pisum sativum TaxID=3888 RepID=UPI0021D11D76|nr:uncharacterized protein LOC127078633 [Pisum sativum]